VVASGVPITSIVSPPAPVRAKSFGRRPVTGSARRPRRSSTTTASAAGAKALATTICMVCANVPHARPSIRIRPSPALATTMRAECICAWRVAVPAS
jgi:hypothetical protein